jgi:hypothetical protein
VGAMDDAKTEGGTAATVGSVADGRPPTGACFGALQVAKSCGLRGFCPRRLGFRGFRRRILYYLFARSAPTTDWIRHFPPVARDLSWSPKTGQVVKRESRP